MLLPNNTPHHTTHTHHVSVYSRFFYYHFLFSLFYSNHLISYYTTYCQNLLFYSRYRSFTHAIPCHSIRHNIFPWSHTLLLLLIVQLPPVVSLRSSYKSNISFFLFEVGAVMIPCCIFVFVFDYIYLFIAYVVHTWLVWKFELVELTSQDLPSNEIRYDSISYSSSVNQFSSVDWYAHQSK